MAKFRNWAAWTFHVGLAQLIVAILTIAVSVILHFYSRSSEGKPTKGSLSDDQVHDSSLSSQKPSENSGQTKSVPSTEKAQDPVSAAKPANARDQGQRDQGQIDVAALKRSFLPGGVLILVAEEETNGVVTAQGPVARSLGLKVADKNLSTTLGSEMSPQDLTAIHRALQKLEAGDKEASGAIPFRVVVSGSISVLPLEPYQGLFVSVANGTLKAVDVEKGLTVARENIADVRGFGNTQEQSRRSALTNAGEKISARFIVHVSSVAR